jgi:polyphosphate glucokinase
MEARQATADGIPASLRSGRGVAGLQQRILSIDIGGSHVKASVLNREGKLLAPARRAVTPQPATPHALLKTIAELADPLMPFSRISAGFPGAVRNGRVITAPNLGSAAWHGFDLARSLADLLDKPSRVLNDADVQGLGTIAGTGFECVLTLGTGVGSAFFLDGRLLPHFELGQHPLHGRKTYDRYLGDAALKARGVVVWNRRLRKTIDIVRTLTNFDVLHLGGGNARLIDFDLPADVRLGSNRAGIAGGAKLWDAQLSDLFRGATMNARRKSRKSNDV